MLYFLIFAALFFDFLNGFRDSSSIVATAIVSGAMHPRTALYMAAVAEFIAPFIFGVAVATTIGKGLIDPSVISLKVVLAAVLAAIFWNLLAWLFGIPSSSSHALIGGLVGAVVVSHGFGVILWPGLIKIVLALFMAPPAGMIIGFIFMHLARALLQEATPRVNETLKRLQILTTLSLAISFGANDSQKTMGMITLGLITAGYQQAFYVPLWVIAISSAVIALGTIFGDWRLIRTLGGRIYKIRPVNALTSQAASAGVVLGAALLGGPVSTSQVVSSAVMGSGAAERLNKVHWLVARDMFLTWALTIPAAALVAAMLIALLSVP